VRRRRRQPGLDGKIEVLDRAGSPRKQHGIDPRLVEATAFAWLAKQALDGSPASLPSVTGARGPRVLGAIYPA